MKKVVYNQYGTIDNLELAEVAMPLPNSKELLIKVKVVALNPIDWLKVEGNLKIVTGSNFPNGLGIDFSGVIEEIGNDVSGFKKGDEVFGALSAMKGEALAEYIVVAPKNIYKKPSSISFENAAAMVTGGAAALYLFESASLKEGDELMINGASGGVGLIALQMAIKKGFKVTAVASGAGLSFIEKWKPNRVIDYKQENVLELKTTFNAWFELAALTPFGKVKHLLKPSSVFGSLKPNPIDMLTAFFNNLISGKKHKIIMANPTQENYKDLCIWVTQKGLEINIAKSFPLQEYKEAYRFAKKGGVIGKVVITI
ncbi:MAG: NAD(P)-dependent alcohol dehydrogenase [Cytophagales bacterium]|nr:MAG: NAD(P)-dependent alcohol dehydrogenase [Cytophagales bacterium]